MAGAILTSRSSRPSSSAADAASQFTTVRLSSLRPGARLHNPILDQRDVLLLAAGSQLTPAVLRILANRGLEFVKVHRSELAACTGGGSGASSAPARPSMNAAVRQRMVQQCSSRDEVERNIPRLESKNQGEFQESVTKHGDDRYDEGEKRKYLATFDQSKNQMDLLFSNLEEIRRTELDVLEGVTETSLTQMAGDMDLFLALGVAPDSELYPAQHSLQSAMLAMSIGSQFGLDKKQLVGLGIGCLAHDAGMLDVDQELIASKSALDPVAFLEITKHPTATFDKMRSVQQLAGTSRLVAYQIHERLNGSGYPRARKGTQIHEMSRIASVADVFVALISPRPHRPGMIPYYAVEHLLHATKGGLFDPKVVRALLKTVSLFPIGSYVELNDGRVGRVMRSNPSSFTQPVIEVWHPMCLNAEPEVVNLADRNHLRVVRPLRSLGKAEKPELELLESWE